MNGGDEQDLYKAGNATATVAPPQPSAAKAAPPPPPDGGSVSWTASEYIDHQRGAGWYLMLILVSAALAAGIYFITKDYISIGVILALGLAVGIFARRQPKQITYELTATGLRVGEKLYLYSVFRSFSVNHDDNLPNITLHPLKRFMPPITVFYAPQDEEHITSVLGEHLSLQDDHKDRLDKLSRRLKL